MKNKIILFSKKILKALKVFISRVLADGGIIEARNYVNSVLKTVGDASLVLIPSAYKTGVLYSILPEDGTGDFTFSRPSGATRVNSQGLIEEVSLLGSELVVNGGFDTDTDWIHRTADSVISGGVVSWNGTQPEGNDIYQQQAGFVVGKTYKASFEIKNYAQGSATIRYGGGSDLGYEIANGIYDYYFVWGGNIYIYVKVSADFIGSIDNVSVVEVFEEGIPRIDYTDGTPVLLTEPQSTNYAFPSDNKNNISLGDIQGTYVPDVLITAPDNSNTAYKYTPAQLGVSVEGANGTNNRIYFETSEINTTYTNSIYVKSVSGNTFNFAIKVTNRASDTLISSKTISVTDVWKRVDVTGLVDGTLTGVRFVIKSEQAVNLWGFQIEQLPYATSYIPTAGATATRLGEVVTVDLSSFIPTITEIIETIDGVDQTPITVIPATYTIPFGNINKIIMNS